jgi:predicted branched-subunit amino acid permease
MVTAGGTAPDVPSTERAGARGWSGGLRMGAGFATATLALAVTFGALARDEGWSLAQAVVASLVVFSGSAQFALLTALAGGGGAVAAVGAATLMNLRFLPMGVAVAGSLEGSRGRRALEGQAIIDSSWAASYVGAGRFDRRALLAATLVQWPAWIGGTLLGAALAPPTDVVERWGLDVVFPAFYLLLLLDSVRSSGAARRVALLGAAITAALLLVVPPGVALLGASAAALLGLRAGAVDAAAEPAPGEDPPAEPAPGDAPTARPASGEDHR